MPQKPAKGSQPQTSERQHVGQTCGGKTRDKGSSSSALQSENRQKSSSENPVETLAASERYCKQEGQQSKWADGTKRGVTETAAPEALGKIPPKTENETARAVSTKPRNSVHYSPVPPPPSVDEATLKRRAAEARAYALSGTSRKKAKTIPMKPPYPYGWYPNYGAAGFDGRNRPATNNLQHIPPPAHPHPYCPPHYYYDYPPHPHGPAMPPSASGVPPPYRMYPPNQHMYPPPQHYSPSPPSPSLSGPNALTTNNTPFPPQPPPPSSYPQSANPTNPAVSPNPIAAARPQSPSHISKAKSTMKAAAPPVPAAAPAPALTTRSLSTTAKPSLPKNSLAHTISGAARLPPRHTTPQKSKTAPEGFDPFMTLNRLRFEDEDDDYVKFVRSLGLQDAESVQVGPEDDDEEDYLLTNLDEEEEEEEEDDEEEENREKEYRGKLDTSDQEVGKRWNENPRAKSTQIDSAPSSPAKKKPAWTLDLPEFDPNFYRELEEELGGLEEEDLEAAVASLLGTTSTSYAHSQKHDVNDGNSSRGDNISSLFAAEAKANEGEEGVAKPESDQDMTDPNQDLEMGTPLRNATGMRTKTHVTSQQVGRLQALLNRHYQILVQQAVLAIQAAHLAKTHRFRDKTDFLSGESADDLVHVLDAAVGMVQDLDQNRKDAIRNAIQFEDNTPIKGTTLFRNEEVEISQPHHTASCSPQGEAGAPRDQRRLTRAAFSKTLQLHTERKSVFNVKGLHRLQETFHALDRSIGSGSSLYQTEVGGERAWYTETCRGMLKQAGAGHEERLLPGMRDLSELFSTSQEYFGEGFQIPCSDDQERFLRRFKGLFTSGEDNLVLRGVNLYGEKQWVLIADRYLPDRSINNISQRYSKLCVMLYKAYGIRVDSNGNLETPPKLDSVEDIDDEKVALIKKAAPPALINVHRWSLEEDLTLLRAVPLMGHMWAELGARLIPHRDRGHLRKRYQVLERRVKATVTRYLKGHDSVTKVALKIREKEQQQDDQRRQEQEQARQQHAKQLPDRHYHHQHLQRTPSHPPLHPRPPHQAHPRQLAPRALPPTRETLNVPTTKPATRPLPNALNNPPPLTTQAPAMTCMPAAQVTTKNATTEFHQGHQKCAEQAEKLDADPSPATLESLVKEDSGKQLHLSTIDEVESEIVGTLANRLAKPGVTAKRPPRAPVKDGPGILASVLDRANQRPAKPNRGMKRKNTLPTTRTSKRFAATGGAKPTPARKSPLLLGCRPGPSSRKASSTSGSGGSPEINSALLEGGNGTLDGLKFDELESQDAREAKGACGSNGSSRSKISAHDMEVVSALNSLSNSPALAVLKPESSPPSTRSRRKGNEEDKSFFAKITGRVKERDTKRKRKLHF